MAVGIAVLLVAGAVWIAFVRPRPAAPSSPAGRSTAGAAIERTPDSPGTDRASTSSGVSDSMRDPEAAAPAVAAAPSPSRLVLPEPSPESRLLVDGLTGGNPLEQTSPEEAVARWKEQHQRLVEQGAAAVPAIWAYLQEHRDLVFGREGPTSLGYRSSREAMIDALQQIGGPEALAVTREVLRISEDPREIALVARSLETQAPELYRGEVLAAARETLSRSIREGVDERDVGPVFEIFEKYGGAGVVADLEQASSQWRYYATLTLGQLPDGAGIPALVQMAEESTVPSIPVLNTLASLSARDPEARVALLEQVRANRIPDSTWPALVQALTGDEMQVADSVFDRVLGRITGEEYSATHIGVGNQSFYWAPTVDSLTPEQIAQQTALIDEIQAAIGDNAAADRALQQARTVLDRRLARTRAEDQNQRP